MNLENVLLTILLVLGVPTAVIFLLGFWAGKASQRRNIRSGRGIEGSPFELALERAWRQGFVKGRNRVASRRSPGGVPVPVPSRPSSPARVPARPVAQAPQSAPPQAVPAASGLWAAPAAPIEAPAGRAEATGASTDAPGAATELPSASIQEPAAVAGSPTGNGFGLAAVAAARPDGEASEHRVLRNINTTLYAAALLLIAAASLSIGLAVPTVAKFTGLVLVTALFYAGGLVIHARSERLRPAATAFTGTGLALIPIAGLAFHLLIVNDARLAWLVTSLVGTAAFIYAAGRLQSKVLAALALTFIVSTTWSSGALLNQALIWYFIVTMMLAGIATVLAHRQPRWLDNIYLRAFQASHRFVVPMTLAAAVFAGTTLDSTDYLVLFTVATGYYGVAVAIGAAEERAVSLTAGRATATLALITAVVEFGAGVEETLKAAAVLLAGQAVLVSLLRVPYGRLLQRSPIPGRVPIAPDGFIRIELRVLGWSALALAVIGNGQMIADGTFPQPAVLWSSLNWVLVLVMAGMAMVAFRERGQLAWMVLAGGICALLEPLGPAPWRQAILLTFSVLATAVVLRSLSGRDRAVLRIGVLAMLPMAVGAISGWAVSGYFPDASGTFPSSSAVNSWLVERASIAGFALLWLANVIGAALVLRPKAASRGRGPAANTRVLLLPIGVLVGLISTLLIDRPEPSLRGSVATGGAVQWLFAQPDWRELLTWATLAVAVTSAGWVLGSKKSQGLPRELDEGSSPGQVRPWAHIAGMLGLVGAVLLVEMSSGKWAAEVVLGVGVIYAGLRSICPGTNDVRGMYSLVAQGCMILAALQIVDYFDADWHAGAAVLAVTLTAGQLARLYLDRPGRPWQGIADRAGTGWLVLAVLALLPFGYSAAVDSIYLFLFNVERGGADQAALLVQLSMLALYGGIWWVWNGAAAQVLRDGRRAWLAMPVVAAVAGLAVVPSGVVELRPGGWLPDPLWNRPVALIILLTVAAALIFAEYSAYRLVQRDTPNLWLKVPLTGAGHHAGPRAVSAVLFIILAAGVAPAGEIGWQAVILLLVAVGLGVYATTLGPAALMAGTVLTVPAAGIAVTRQLVEAGGMVERQAWEFPISATLGAVLLYAFAVAAGRFRITPPGARAAVRALSGRDGPGWTWTHSVVLSAGGLVVLAVASVAANSHGVDWLSYAGCVGLAATAVVAVFEWPERWREQAAELAALVIAGCIHRVWLLAAGPAAPFWQAQYWVVVVALLACFEYFRGRGQRGEWVVIASAALLSTSGLTTVIHPDPWQSAWTLTGHTVLLVFGLLTNRRHFVVWGAVGICLAIVWYLRGYTFLLLSLLAMALIALAVWRLVRLRTRSD